MPKHRNVVKKNGVVHKYNTPNKFRVGTRSSGVAAHTMSTADLKAVLDSKDKAKYHKNARAVLSLRGVDLSNAKNSD